jgi:VWFA-related protein
MKRLLASLTWLLAGPLMFAQAPPPQAPPAQTPPQAPQGQAPTTQTTQPIFRAAVDVLRVDVQVVAGDGQPVHTLGLDDFTVHIDGKPRKVVSAELVRYSQSAADGMLAAVPIRTPGRVPEDSRLYVIAVDQTAFSTGAIMPMRRALQQFINQLRPEDMVGLYEFPFREPLLDVTHDHGKVVAGFARLSGLLEPALGVFSLAPSEIIDITAGDSDTLRRVVARECQAGDTTCADAVRQEASAVAGYLEADAQQRLSSLSHLMRGLTRVSGRKTVVLVSGGMISSARAGGRPDVSMLMSRVGREAAAADANLYVLHWDGTYLDAYSAANKPSHNPSDRFASVFEDRHAIGQGLEMIAGKAGGAFLRIEAGTGEYAFNRVLRETASYYLLGVEPDALDADGRAHFLRVNVTQRGVTVRVRTEIMIPRRTGATE